MIHIRPADSRRCALELKYFRVDLCDPFVLAVRLFRQSSKLEVPTFLPTSLTASLQESLPKSLPESLLAVTAS